MLYREDVFISFLLIFANLSNVIDLVKLSLGQLQKTIRQNIIRIFYLSFQLPSIILQIFNSFVTFCILTVLILRVFLFYFNLHVLPFFTFDLLDSSLVLILVANAL